MRYIKIYNHLLNINLQVLFIYKANLINSIISTIVWGAMSYLSIFLLTSKAHTVYGWSQNELLLLTALYNIIIGTFHTIFSRNFERFSRIIDHAEIDTLLVKPVDSQFLVSFWWFNYTGIVRIVTGIIFVIILSQWIHLNMSLINFIYFFILSFIGLVLMYSVWFIFSTLIIWYPRLSNLVDVLYQVNGVTRYPQEIFRNAGVFIVFFLFPLTLIITLPTKLLLGKINLPDVLFLLLFTSILFLISRIFWKFALRSYTSASG